MSTSPSVERPTGSSTNLSADSPTDGSTAASRRSEPPDVERLLDSSHPRRPIMGRTVTAGVVAFLLFMAFGASTSMGGNLWALPMILALGGLILLMLLGRRDLAARTLEARRVEQLDEAVQLRNWDQALHESTALLAKPMRAHAARLAALASFSIILARHHWFDQARIVYDYLLDDDRLGFDHGAGHALRVARAVTMLRQDHLVDADRALTDLRREVSRTRDAFRYLRDSSQAHAKPSDDTPREPDVDSGLLALVELYRDIKTGHFVEAVELFRERIRVMRSQLGMRVADAWVLVARAYQGLSQEDDAALAYHHATVLAPAIELHRRYPETATLAAIYTPARKPDETVAGATGVSGVT